MRNAVEKNCYEYLALTLKYHKKNEKIWIDTKWNQLFNYNYTERTILQQKIAFPKFNEPKWINLLLFEPLNKFGKNKMNLTNVLTLHKALKECKEYRATQSIIDAIIKYAQQTGVMEELKPLIAKDKLDVEHES